MPSPTYGTEGRNSLRSLLTKLLRSTNPAQADVFTKSLGPASSLAEIRDAFRAATDPKLIIDIPKKVNEWLKLFYEPSFDDSEDYATAFSDEIHDTGIVPLLEAMVSSGGIPKKRYLFVERLWNRLDINGRRIVGARLSEAITREVPNGSWPNLLRMLYALDKTGWGALTKLCRIRLERALIDDLNNGYVDHHSSLSSKGSLGTWVKLFYTSFNKKGEVLDTIATLLHEGWYRQNYVGDNFMKFLPKLVEKPEDRQRLIAGLAAAVKNDAYRVKNNLKDLPEEWRADIEKEIKGDSTTT